MDFLIETRHTCTENPIQGDFPMHIHNDSHEIYCFLSGDAGYSVEGNRYQLAHGDLMLMRKGEVHHLMLNSDVRYERMVVNFDLSSPSELDPDGRLLAAFNDRSLGKYNHYLASLFPDNQWLYYIQKMEGCPTPQQKLCYLLPLLNDLADCFETVKNSDAHVEKDRAAAVIKYINRHLSDDLSLISLAERFYLSKTHLNRLFKQSTGTTVWDYIIVKRLFLARKLINAGESPSKVYSQCGFQDYTTFYRAYKQHFGVCPKCDAPRFRTNSGKINPQQEVNCNVYF